MGYRRRVSRWGLLLAVGAAGLTALAAGCSGGSGSELPDPQTRPAARATAFSSCEELTAYLAQVAATEAELGSRHMGDEWRGIGAPGGAGPVFGGDSAPPSAGGESLGEREYTGTNVQEEGVDEPDFVKSDGEHLYVLADGKLVIVDAWPPADAREVGRLEISGTPAALFVHGATVAVVSTSWQDMLEVGFSYRSSGLVRLTLVDAADKTNPSVLRELTYEGAYTDARMVEGRVHLVLTTYLPTLWGSPGLPPPGELSPQGPADGAADLLPRYSDRLYGASGVAEEISPACTCENTYFPSVPNGTGLISLMTVDLAEPAGPVHAVSLLSESGAVYGSAQSLYLATPNTGVWGWWGADGALLREPDLATVVHKFTLGEEPAYAASGEVKGWVLNQFSLGEHAGTLRIATSENRWWDSSGPQNRVFVLEQEGEALAVTGELAGLGKPGESIFAVRFLGDRGYVVTFLQVDPLYVLDLSEPAAPAVAGELEVPGFSTYLHPLEGGYLLAVGQNVEDWGVDLSIFDVRDASRPALAHRLSVGAGSISEAQYDHHAFTYFPSERLLALPVTTWQGNPGVDAFGSLQVFNGLHLYDVDLEAGFGLRATIDHEAFYRDQARELWYYPEGVRRSFFIREEPVGSYLYSVSPRGIVVTGPMTDPDLRDVAAVPLPAQEFLWADAYAVEP